MEIRDVSGLSRFKNGFIVDNFASLATSDTLHPDYRVSVDFEQGYESRGPLHNSSTSNICYFITKRDTD